MQNKWKYMALGALVGTAVSVTLAWPGLIPRAIADEQPLKMLQASKQELLGKNFRDYLHLSDRRTLRSIYRRMQRYKRAESAIRMIRTDGAEVVVWLTMIERADGGFFAATRDITRQTSFERQLEESLSRLSSTRIELESANEKLRILASTDGLTGLLNHREFHRQLNSIVELAERGGPEFCAVMIDVDHFKAYNDAHGHPAGDEVLRELSATLRKCTRSIDCVARYGGEEFAILLPQTDAAGGFEMAERMRTSLETKSWPSQPITASFGVATSASFSSAKEIMNAADQALYLAKEQGRNRVVLAVP